MKKKVISLLALVFAWSALTAGWAGATAIIDSTTGGDYYFQWEGGLGQIENIYTTSGPGGLINSIDLGVDWSITVSRDSLMDFATAWDSFIVGDVFGLVVDGTPLAWKSTSFDVGGYFHGRYDNLFLTAGTHIITLELTDLASGYTAGGAYASFSGTSPVPEPATIFLLGSGILGMATYSRKRNVSSRMQESQS